MNENKVIPAKAFSDTMRTCSLLCSVLVIYIHTYNVAVYSDVTSHAMRWIEEAFSQCLAYGAVPFFFMSSAFFLYSGNKTVKQVYKSRFRSLVIPYLLWNLLYTVLFAVLRYFSLSNSGMETLTLGGLAEGILLHRYNYAYWFMMYLIIFTLLYPVIRFILEKGKALAFALLVIMTLLLWRESGPIINAVYYYIGAMAGYYLRERTESLVVLERKNKLIVLAALFLAGAALFFATKVRHYELILLRNLVMALLIFFFVISFNIRVGSTLMGLSFMIYSMHTVFLETVEHIIYIVLPHNVWGMAVGFFFAPLICIGLIFVTCRLMVKICPNLYKLLNGGHI